MKRHTKDSIRVGHTRWKVVFYDADKFLNHSEPFCAIYNCFVTSVKESSLSYNCIDAGYICGKSKFLDITEPTFRKAYAKAKRIISDYEYERDLNMRKGHK